MSTWKGTKQKTHTHTQTHYYLQKLFILHSAVLRGGFYKDFYKQSIFEKLLVHMKTKLHKGTYFRLRLSNFQIQFFFNTLLLKHVTICPQTCIYVPKHSVGWAIIPDPGGVSRTLGNDDTQEQLARLCGQRQAETILDVTACCITHKQQGCINYLKASIP